MGWRETRSTHATIFAYGFILVPIKNERWKVKYALRSKVGRYAVQANFLSNEVAQGSPSVAELVIIG